MNTFIVFSGSKYMGNDISLIILVISQNFQNGGGGHFGFWKNGGRKNFNPDIPSICDPSWAQISNCFACNNHSPAANTSNCTNSYVFASKMFILKTQKKILTEKSRFIIWISTCVYILFMSHTDRTILFLKWMTQKMSHKVG